jgi:hypothetical protein
MSGDEREPDERGNVEEEREREEGARRARADAEAERAAAERDAELGKEDEGGVVPADSDEERAGVMRPPAGAGPD